MNDHISGVVVLQPYLKPGLFRLWFEYTRADGIIGYSTIPMKRKGEPMPQLPENQRTPVWDFVEKNPLLECSPSVRILGPHNGAPDHFHNTGLWTNPYVVMASGYGEEGESHTANEVCEMINKFKTKEERDGVIFSLRAERVLL